MQGICGVRSEVAPAVITLLWEVVLLTAIDPAILLNCRYYPFHYAPLISDLAKFATGGRRSKATVGGEVMSLDDDSWAPANGPVRPLVQLMAVLPPER